MLLWLAFLNGHRPYIEAQKRTRCKAGDVNAADIEWFGRQPHSGLSTRAGFGREEGVIGGGGGSGSGVVTLHFMPA